MKIKTFLLIILSFIFLVSCAKKEEETNKIAYIYEPGVPGSNLDAAKSVRPLINFRACPNVLNIAKCPPSSLEDKDKITLTWNVPNLYKTEDYIVVIFKLEEGSAFDDANGETRLGLERPQNNLGVISYEIGRVKGESFVDTDVTPGNTYLYYGFIVIDGYLQPTPLTGQQVLGTWSAHTLEKAESMSSNYSEGEPAPQTFWEKKKWSYGGPAGVVGGDIIANLRTYSPGNATSSFPKGRIAVDDSGSTMFISDTDNNRIIVYENSNLRNCLVTLLDTPEAEDPELRDMYVYSCYLQSGSSNLAAHNVLGQTSQFESLSCQEQNDECGTYSTATTCTETHSNAYGRFPSYCQWKSNTCIVKGNQCLTKPTEILYHKGKLIVSDTGNNRVVLYENILFNPGTSIKDTSLTLIGCDPEIIPGSVKPTKCEFQKVFGKKSFNDFSTYPILIAGESSLSGPTGLMVDGDDLYIADTLNNRIVKSSNYYGTEAGDGTDLNMYYNCDESSWLTTLCRWSGVMGQSNYTEKKSFQEFFDADNEILTGTFSNILADGNLLKRYFKNPTKINKMYKENGDVIFLVLSNESFSAISDLGTRIALRSRILMFDDIPLKGNNPLCNTTTFLTGECDATAVIGQESFEKLIILSGSAGGAGDYKNVGYGLDEINDFEVKSRDMYAVDGKSNQIYVWKDLPKNNLIGKSYTYKVLDPAGEYNDTIGGNLPTLSKISGIQYSESGDYIFIVDGGAGYIYQLSFFNISF